MRLLFVHNHLSRGGTEKVMLDLGRGLRHRGHMLTVAAGDGVWRDRFEKEEMDWVPLLYGPERDLATLIPRIWKNARVLRRTIEHVQPDALVVHSRFMLPPSLLASRGKRLPIVFYSHSDYGSLSPTGATAVIAVSRAAGRCAKGRAFIIPNGAEDLFREYEDSSVSRDLLCVGRLEKDKGIEDLLRALELLARHGLRPRLCLAGEGGCRTRLVRMIRGYGLDDQVEFLGPVDPDPDTLATLYASARVVVIPSIRREGFSLVKAEAMSAGRPVVVTKVGGLPEGVQDEINGFIVPARDPGSLAAALRRILLDTPIREAMARKARETWERTYSVQRMIDEVEAALRTVIGARS